MTIKKPIPIAFNLDSRQSVQSVCAVIHIDDKNTETLDLSLMQGGEHIAVSPNSTVTARFVRVKDKILISDNVPCAVQENGNIHIPIDNAAAHMLVGEIKIEVTIVDENDILTMQFPLVIKVNNTILADAEISPESEGTIPELLEEAKEAAESAAQAAEAATEAISTKQDKLTAGQNITITEENVISASSGSNDYTDLTNKPSINNVTLSGNKSSDDLSLQGKLTAGNNITIEGNVISAAGGGVTSYNDLTDKPKIKIKVQDAESTELGVVDVDIEGVFNLPYGFKLYYDSVGGKSLGLYKILTESLNDAKNFLVGQNIYSPYKYDFNTLSNDFRRAGMWEATAQSCMHVPSFITSSFVSGYSNYDFLIIHYYAHAHVAGGAPIARCVVGKDKDGDFRIFYQFIRLSNNNDGTITSQTDWVELTGGGSQIVSGAVNANGTITFTDSEGNSFTTSGSNLVTSGNEQISMGHDEGGFYFLFDDGQEEVNNGTD